MRKHSSRGVLVTLLLALGLMTPTVGVATTSYSSAPEASWIPTNGRVYAIVSDGQRVYLGGTFTRVKDPVTGKSVVRNRLAAFDATTGALDLSWNPNADGGVRALALGTGGTLYVGGSFSQVGGQAATRLAQLDASGAALPDFTAAASGEVRDLVVTTDALYVAGNFGTVSGLPRVGVAKLNPATGSVTAWNARVGQGRVVALALSESQQELVIGGNFKRVAGAEVWFLASVDLATAARTSLDGGGVGSDDDVWTPQRVCDTCNLLDVAVDSGSVYGASAGGGGGRAAAWSAITDGRARWIVRGDGDVQAVAVRDGVVYAGGHMEGEFGPVERHQLAAVDAATGAVLDYAVPFTGLDQPGIWAVVAEPERLRIGGGFTGIAGSSAARYAVLPAVDPVTVG